MGRQKGRDSLQITNLGSGTRAAEGAAEGAVFLRRGHQASAFGSGLPGHQFTIRDGPTVTFTEGLEEAMARLWARDTPVGLVVLDQRSIHAGLVSQRVDAPAK